LKPFQERKVIEYHKISITSLKSVRILSLQAPSSHCLEFRRDKNIADVRNYRAGKGEVHISGVYNPQDAHHILSTTPMSSTNLAQHYEFLH